MYGIQFLERFAAQQPEQYVCGDLQGLQLQTLMAGTGNATVAAAGMAMLPFANDSAVQFAPPGTPEDPLFIGTLYAAIFNQTQRTEAARLYMNWLLELENPNNGIWTVRTDAVPLQGQPPLWELPNSNHTAFLTYMQDYEGRERFSKQLDLYLGTAQGCAATPLRAGIRVP